MTEPNDFSQAERPKGMSTGAKVALILGGIGGLVLLLCCGGLFIFGYGFSQFAKNATTNDPEVIRQRTREMASIDIPAEFEPQQAINVVFMKMIMYAKPDASGNQQNNGVLLLMSIDPSMVGAGAGDTQRMKDEMLKSFRQQQQQQGGQRAELTVESTESREFTINGEACTFEFSKGKDKQSQRAKRQVTGAFSTRNGVVMLMLFVPEDEYDEPAIIRMIESIRQPNASPAANQENKDEQLIADPDTAKADPDTAKEE